MASRSLTLTRARLRRRLAAQIQKRRRKLSHRPTGEAEKITARRAEVLRLRIAGLSTREIAAIVGVDHSTVADDVHVELTIASDRRQQLRAELLELEVRVIDEIQISAWPRAIRGDVRSGELVLKCSVQRARLLGLFPDGIDTPSYLPVAPPSAVVDVTPEDALRARIAATRERLIEAQADPASPPIDWSKFDQLKQSKPM
jgi:DNA-binding CsgD family transcriptional regulator